MSADLSEISDNGGISHEFCYPPNSPTSAAILMFYENFSDNSLFLSAVVNFSVTLLYSFLQVNGDKCSV